MTHPTAYASSTAIRRPTPSSPAIDRHECKHSLSDMAAHRSPIRIGSVFRSGAANYLEMRHAEFHYSVNGCFGTALPASGYAGCRPLIDEVPASQSEVATASARASGAGE
jgi:hypothetical protein